MNWIVLPGFPADTHGATISTVLSGSGFSMTRGLNVRVCSACVFRVTTVGAVAGIVIVTVGFS